MTPEIIRPQLLPGDTVYEVFITAVRKATVESVYEYNPGGNFKKGALCTIICEDGSLSPRYFLEDIGTFLFVNREEAEKKAQENREIVEALKIMQGYDGREVKKL